MIPKGFTKEYIEKQRLRIEANRESWPAQLHALAERTEKCNKCSHLAQTRKMYSYGKPTFGYGNPRSGVVLIAQAPGWRGCGTTGFVFEPLSRTGKVYQDVLAAAGLTFEDVYTTNLVKCCVYGSDAPTNAEIKNCSPICVREIKLINPYYIIAVGKIAWNFILKSKLYRDYSCHVIHHPGYILRKGTMLSSYICKASFLLSDAYKDAKKRGYCRGLESWLTG